MTATSAAVKDFLPSRCAFRFTNNFPHQPVVRIPFVGRGIAIGDASRGLCGGMIYTVRDLFEANRQPPDGTDHPPLGSPMYRYIVRRLMESWNLPGGVMRYYRLQRTPDDRVGRVTVADEWPRVRASLDAGQLTPLGLIATYSRDPNKLGLNHQVLAYRYDLDGTKVTIHVYDPNTPVHRADDVTITFDTATADGPVPITHNVAIGQRPIRTFFLPGYRWSDPARIFA